MQQLVNTALGGITLGMVFAAFALALVMIWRSTRIVNFAQAAMAMVTTMLALSLIERGWSYWAAFLAALATGFVLGAVIERTLVRRVEGTPIALQNVKIPVFMQAGEKDHIAPPRSIYKSARLFGGEANVKAEELHIVLVASMRVLQAMAVFDPASGTWKDSNPVTTQVY